LSKPVIEVAIGDPEANVFHLTALCREALLKEGEVDKARILVREVFGAGSYDEAVEIMNRYVEVVVVA
jgi:hypothetical protein